MRSADFWGLKSTNDAHVTDASTLITTGFEQGYRNFEGRPKFSLCLSIRHNNIKRPVYGLS
jgi:hypothetical protein